MTDERSFVIGRAVLLAIALAVPAAGAAAQQPRPRPATPASARLGSLRGVLYDSLAHRPLEGARVLVRGSSVATTTDAGGRFRLDSLPPGRVLLLVEHAALDSVGLSGLVRQAQVTAGRITVIELAVPSLWTMRRAACRGRGAPSTSDSGVVYGAVRDADTGVRLAGARVIVSWVTASRSETGVRVERPNVTVPTDSAGNYYACDIPTEYVVTVEAAAGHGSTGRTELLLGERSVGRRDLLVSRDSATLDAASGLLRGRALLRGRVLDEFDRPRPSARVSVDDAVGEAFTDSAGQFLLRNLPAGSHMLMARFIGYSAARLMVDLRHGDTTEVEVRMRAVTTLDTIRVTASRRANAEIAGIEERARLGFGYRLDAEALRTRTSMRAVFEGLPSLNLSGQSVYRFRLTSIQSGRVCAVSLYIDGVRASEEELQSYRPDHLLAVEYYVRPAEVPARFQVIGSQCPVALVWTRFIR